MANRNGLKWQIPFLLLLIVGTVLILRKQAPYQTDQGLVFGTMYKITYQSKENLKTEIEAELQKVDRSLSPFNKQSVITHINNNTDMQADSLFAYVFRLAKQISEETHGAFDITVAPLVNAWGFGFKNADNVDSLTIDSLRQFVGFEKIRLEDGKVIKSDPRTMLDCSAIAKGAGLQRHSQRIRSGLRGTAARPERRAQLHDRHRRGTGDEGRELENAAVAHRHQQAHRRLAGYQPGTANHPPDFGCRACHIGELPQLLL